MSWFSDNEKTDAQKAHEQGQRDGSTDDWYSGWMHKGDELDAYNAGYRNGRDHPAKNDE